MKWDFFKSGRGIPDLILLAIYTIIIFGMRGMAPDQSTTPPVGELDDSLVEGMWIMMAGSQIGYIILYEFVVSIKNIYPEQFSAILFDLMEYIFICFKKMTGPERMNIPRLVISIIIFIGVRANVF